MLVWLRDVVAQYRDPLVSGVTAVLADHGIFDEKQGELVISGRLGAFVIEIRGRQYHGRLSGAHFNSELHHLPIRFGFWIEDHLGAPTNQTIDAIAKHVCRHKNVVRDLIWSGDIPQRIVLHFSGRVPLKPGELQRWVLHSPVIGDSWAMRRSCLPVRQG